MRKNYLGTVSDSDPLYGVLLSHWPHAPRPRFHVERMSHRHVYKYTVEGTGEAIVGKFYAPNDPNKERIERKKREFDNLTTIRAYGFDRAPFMVVRPLGRDETIGLAVIEEFIKGLDLDHFLKKAVHEGASARLVEVLSQLASFLSSLHSRTRGTAAVSTDQSDAHFEKILCKLSRQALLTRDERCLLSALKERWLARFSMRHQRAVMIHGDATPTNFIFTAHRGVVAIDLERMRQDDPAYDVGMICGELKHAFLWRTGDPRASEPFIRHFLAHYCREASDHGLTFRSLTQCLPFYMALTELRIARNEYLDFHYRKRLIGEAMECLRWGLMIG